MNKDLYNSAKGEIEFPKDKQDHMKKCFRMVKNADENTEGFNRNQELQNQNFIDQAHISTDGHHLQTKVFLDVNVQEETSLKFIVKDGNEVVESWEEKTDLNENVFTSTKHLHFEKWTLDNPKLYTMEIYINDVLSFSDRFADRQIEMTEKGFFLNKEHIKLYGLNRHQSFPYVGYAMPENAQKKDADILKYDLGVNVVRSSHYPPSKHFLDRCDEIGLLVFNEIPGWQHIGNKEWQDVAVNNTYEMIYRDYNHPSIFIWGTRINESPDNDTFYQNTYDMAKSMDTTRPIGGVRNFKASNLIEDVYTYNDFVHRGNNEGIESPKSIAKKVAPHLVTEYNGHMFPTKKIDDEAHRVEHAKRHLTVQNDSFKNEAVSGAIGWCMFDYNTHKDFGSGDRICYHGVMDMFRSPKYASGVYRSQSDASPFIQILGNLNVGEHEASEIKELMILTNADSIKFHINKDYIGEFYPTDQWGALPHSPVIIDDFIGNLIHENEDFSKKDADTVKMVLLHIMQKGFQMPLKMKIKMGLFLKRNNLSIDQAAKLYETYVGKWGQESITYRFEAIKDGQVVAEEIIGATYGSELKVSQDDTVLENTDTYQTTRFIVEHVNLNGNPLVYSTEIINIEVDGPIEVIGPKQLTLTGGSVGFWVKSTKQKGKAKVKISNHYYGKQEFHIEVK